MANVNKKLASICTSLFIMTFLASTNGQKFSVGSCPTVTPSAVIQTAIGSTTGYRWYEYSRTVPHFDYPVRCQNYFLVYDSTNTRYSITVTGVNKFSGDTVTTNGLLLLPRGNAIGLFFADFPSIYRHYYPINYYVIQTDATSGTTQTTYMVLYSCKNVGIGKLENVIILTSLRYPLETTVTTALGAAATRVPSTWMKTTDQTNC